MQAQVQQWFDTHTFRGVGASASELAQLSWLKSDTTVSVVLPALNEQDTVGAIVAEVRSVLVDVDHPLVDELIVLDSGSTDATSAVARRAGAEVVHVDDVLAEWPSLPGKGEALWRSVAATSGDIVVFVDADLLQFSASTVTGLLHPLLADPGLALVKATYDRPLADGARVHPAGGGRVTELVARPLLNLHWPSLAGFVQPLAGEYAARRDLLERLPFPTGYGVELGLLIDALDLVGLAGLAQVDLGERRHRHHDDQTLGRMAAEIWQTAWTRLHRAGVSHAHRLDPTLTQFTRVDDADQPVTHEVTALERPALVTVSGYARSRINK